jgi:hypothetical protein
MNSKGELAIGKNEVMDMDKVDIRVDKVTVNTIEQTDPDGYLAKQEVPNSLLVCDKKSVSPGGNMNNDLE